VIGKGWRIDDVGTAKIKTDCVNDGLTLSVIAAHTLTTHPLPSEGAVTIGRSAKAIVRIDDASVSRAHAILQLGATCYVEDLGSLNGTRVGGTRLEPRRRQAIAIGEAVEIGSVTVVVLSASHAAPPPPHAPTASTLPGWVVVRDPAMVRLYELAERVAQGTISVLLLGETGTGKEVLAEAIHRASPRHKRPLLCLNCAALSENLLESELFGHEKGAFSGAIAAKPGLLETAHGGTVFLDEIGEMPLALQAKLLRVLEERRITRVGGLKPIPIDVRFIAATHRELEQEIRKGTFRQDFFYRLNGISLVIPALRERPAEIAELAEAFLQRASREAGRREAPPIAEEAMALLQRHSWPGNIRELRNVMERAVLTCVDDPVITLAHLPVEKMLATGTSAESLTRPGPAAATQTDLGFADDERSRIVDALNKCGGNQSHAARLLGISRGTLGVRLATYGLPRPRKRTSF